MRHRKEKYWRHYSTRHDTHKYATLRQELEMVIHREFNGGARAATPTIAFYERPPPARLGAFEVVLTMTDPLGGVHHVLLHTKLGTSKFPSTRNIVQRLHNLLGSKRAAYKVKPTSRGLKETGNNPITSSHWRTRAPTAGGFDRNGVGGSTTRATMEENDCDGAPCEFCGETNYRTLTPIWDRHNYAEEPEHGACVCVLVESLLWPACAHDAECPRNRNRNSLTIG